MAINREALIEAALSRRTRSCRARSRTLVPGDTASRCSSATGRVCRCRRSTSPRRKAAGQGGRRQGQVDHDRHHQLRSTRWPPPPTSVRQAADEIGLNAKIDSVSAANYIDLFESAVGAQGRRHVPDLQLPGLRRPRRRSTTPSRCRAAARTSTTSAIRRSPRRSRRRGPPPTPTSAPRSSPRRAPDHAAAAVDPARRARLDPDHHPSSSPAHRASFVYMGGPVGQHDGG